MVNLKEKKKGKTEKVGLTSSWEDMFADRNLRKETDFKKGAACLEQEKVACKDKYCQRVRPGFSGCPGKRFSLTCLFLYTLTLTES